MRVRTYLRWYRRRIERNWSLEAAKIVVPMFGVSLLYATWADPGGAYHHCPDDMRQTGAHPFCIVEPRSTDELDRFVSRGLPYRPGFMRRTPDQFPD